MEKTSGFDLLDFKPWDVSATGTYFSHELKLIRDAHIDDVVDLALEVAENVSPSNVILELIAHGNYQKAALVLKSLMGTSEKLDAQLLIDCTYNVIFLLQNENLLKLPRNIDEAYSYLKDK